MAKFNERYWSLWEDARDHNYRITRQEFAESMGVTAGQSNGWLDNGNQPDCDNLLKIANQANVSVSWLVGETEVRNLQMVDMLEGLPTDIIDEIANYAEYLVYKRYKRKTNNE